LATAEVEMAAAAEFDVTLVNDDVRRSAEELVSLMRSNPDGNEH
jgi:guanylate kinase